MCIFLCLSNNYTYYIIFYLCRYAGINTVLPAFWLQDFVFSESVNLRVSGSFVVDEVQGFDRAHTCHVFRNNRWRPRFSLYIELSIFPCFALFN